MVHGLVRRVEPAADHARRPVDDAHTLHLDARVKGGILAAHTVPVHVAVNGRLHVGVQRRLDAHDPGRCRVRGGAGGERVRAVQAVLGLSRQDVCVGQRPFRAVGEQEAAGQRRAAKLDRHAAARGGDGGGEPVARHCHWRRRHRRRRQRSRSRRRL